MLEPDDTLGYWVLSQVALLEVPANLYLRLSSINE